jgi:hypothetical protein
MYTRVLLQARTCYRSSLWLSQKSLDCSKILPAINMKKAKFSNKPLTIGTLNPLVKEVEYAVRGPIVIRAVKLEKELEKVLFVNIETLAQL